MKKILGILALLAAGTAFAGLQFFDVNNTNLGVYSAAKCSTGVDCSVVGGKIAIVASQTLTAPLTITATEAADASLTMEADDGDDNGDGWKLSSVASGNAFSIANDTSGSYVDKFTLSTAGAVSMVGDLSGDGGDQFVGFLQNRVLATATTLTAAQCGSTIYNSGAIEIELPEASTVLGCRYTFIVANASALTVDPDGADQIVLLTNAAGDAIAADAVGESVTIEALSASEWAPVGAEKGTWVDSN